MRHRLTRCALLVLLLGTETAHGAPPGAQQEPSFRSRAAIVSLFSTVTDAQKRLVPALVQDDFEVFDNDKPQPLVVFDNAARPITVVVLLDTSGSMTAN